MVRDLSTEMQAETAKAVKSPILLVEAEFKTDIFRAWTGLGVVSWNGEDWYGTGDIGSISNIDEASALESSGLKIGLKGVKTENFALATDEIVQGLPVTVWFGYLSEAGEIIADPVDIFEGSMDKPEIRRGADTIDIALNIEGPAELLNQENVRYRTHEDQQLDYPDDDFFEYVAGLQNAEVTWG